jgi:uncharacterized membrane protein YvbJ
MSQAKVDRNKEQKRNVKKIMAQERRSWMLTQTVLIAIAAAVVIWIGVSLYQAVNAPSTDSSAVQSVTYTVDSSALEDYLASLDHV